MELVIVAHWFQTLISVTDGLGRYAISTVREEGECFLPHSVARLVHLASSVPCLIFVYRPSLAKSELGYCVRVRPLSPARPHPNPSTSMSPSVRGDAMSRIICSSNTPSRHVLRAQESCIRTSPFTDPHCTLLSSGPSVFGPSQHKKHRKTYTNWLDF